MNENLYLLYRQIINLLAENDFEIPNNELAAINHIAETARIYSYRNDSAKIIRLPLYTDKGEYIKDLQVKSENQTVDIVPLVVNGMILKVVPSVILLNNASMWIIIHEICHLISIGKYIFYNNCVFHSFGVLEYKYEIIQDRLEQKTYSGHNGVNELVNDYATWYFMDRIYGNIQPKYFGLYAFDKYLEEVNVQKEKLIGYYFAGETGKIKKCLLKNQFDSYESLYAYLTNQVKEGKI